MAGASKEIAVLKTLRMAAMSAMPMMPVYSILMADLIRTQPVTTNVVIKK
jgi:trans-2-enoyl-CoA reductase